MANRAKKSNYHNHLEQFRTNKDIRRNRFKKDDNRVSTAQDLSYTDIYDFKGGEK